MEGDEHQTIIKHFYSLFPVITIIHSKNKDIQLSGKKQWNLFVDETVSVHDQSALFLRLYFTVYKILIPHTIAISSWYTNLKTRLTQSQENVPVYLCVC